MISRSTGTRLVLYYNVQSVLRFSIIDNTVSHEFMVVTSCALAQGSYGSLKSMKVQDFLVVKIMYLNVLNFPEAVEKSIKVHIKRV